MALQLINLGAAPNDGTGDPIRTAGDKINDNFTEIYGETLKLKGSTDCSANPNYPAALKADVYRVSVAGKIGGASGTVVEAGDLYYALADNAGGTQAGVGASWDVIQGNVTSPGGSLEVEDEGASEATGVTKLNFVGAGVTATDQGGGEVEVNIPGGGGSSSLAFGVTIDGGGSAITTGIKGFVRVPVAHTITKATALADQSGDIVVDIWRDSLANYPPTNADSVTASAPVTISADTNSEDSTLTGWSTSGSAGDVYGFNVDSVTDLTRVTIQIEATV